MLQTTSQGPRCRGDGLASALDTGQLWVLVPWDTGRLGKLHPAPGRFHSGQAPCYQNLAQQIPKVLFSPP